MISFYLFIIRWFLITISNFFKLLLWVGVGRGGEAEVSENACFAVGDCSPP